MYKFLLYFTISVLTCFFSYANEFDTVTIKATLSADDSQLLHNVFRKGSQVVAHESQNRGPGQTTFALLDPAKYHITLGTFARQGYSPTTTNNGPVGGDNSLKVTSNQVDTLKMISRNVFMHNGAVLPEYEGKFYELHLMLHGENNVGRKFDFTVKTPAHLKHFLDIGQRPFFNKLSDRAPRVKITSMHIVAKLGDRRNKNFKGLVQIEEILKANTATGAAQQAQPSQLTTDIEKFRNRVEAAEALEDIYSQAIVGNKRDVSPHVTIAHVKTNDANNPLSMDFVDNLYRALYADFENWELSRESTHVFKPITISAEGLVKPTSAGGKNTYVNLGKVN